MSTNSKRTRERFMVGVSAETYRLIHGLSESMGLTYRETTGALCDIALKSLPDAKEDAETAILKSARPHRGRNGRPRNLG